MALKRQGFIAGAVVGVGVAAAAMAGAGMHWPGAVADPQAIQGGAPVGPLQNAPMSFAPIIEKVAPAVVSIEVTSHLNAQTLRAIPGFPGFPFNFPNGGDDDEDNGGGSNGANGSKGNNGRAPQGPEATAAGSGFFISPDGYIVTNNHVIENAESIKVTLNDQRELTARIIGRDEATDLAVLKVDGGPFPYVTFETQSKPRVGDWVIADGNPFLLGGTVTAGIISAEARDIGEQFVDYLQIDAPINRGNSGGPTFDLYGRVVGVNTAIFSPTGGSVGIGFAIPADIASSTVDQLIRTGHVVRGYLGVSIQNVTPDVAASLGIAARHGALVGDVTPGGPADRAGVQTGDVIMAVNGTPVASNSGLTRIVAAARPGEPLVLDVLRNGRRLTLTARSGVRPSEEQLARLNGQGEGEQGGGPGAEAPSARILGMGLAPLDDAARRRLNLPPNLRGVLIESVSSGSDAYHIGLRQGDVIVRAGDRPVLTPADVAAAVAETRRLGRPSILLLINHNGTNIFVPVKLDNGPGK